MLTALQERVWHLIAEGVRDEGAPPTLEEIAWRAGLGSPGAARQVVVALETKGYLARTPRRRRSLVLRRWPDGETTPPRLLRLPVVGEVSAGRPLDATDAPGEHEWVAADLAGTPDAYLLRVRGHSMIGDGVLDGDLVVVQPGARVGQGEMAIARLADGSCTIKRIYREGGHVRLQPANPVVEALVVPDVELIGRVVAVIRRVGAR